jgi:hypothetical protein
MPNVEKRKHVEQGSVKGREVACEPQNAKSRQERGCISVNAGTKSQTEVT